MSARFETITIQHDNGDRFFAVWDAQEKRIVSERYPARGNDHPNPAYPDRAWFFVQELTIQHNTVERNKAHEAAWQAVIHAPGFAEFARARGIDPEGATWPVQEMLLRRWGERDVRQPR